MNHTLDKDFHFLSLLKFSFPSILMMVFLSTYTIVDGVFVSRFVNTDALSAINIVLPFINIVYGTGIMFATGGSAIVAKKMGEGKFEEARGNFTAIILFAGFIGLLITIFGSLFLTQILNLLGATEKLMPYCREYASIFLIFTVSTVLKMVFDFFLITAGKPGLGLVCSIAGGVTNIILDYVFIVVFGWGIKGAAFATAIGEIVAALIGLIYFLNKSNNLHLTKPLGNMNLIARAAGNGASEMVTNLASGITIFLFNMAMLRLLGEDGVAAITIITYLQFLLSAIFIGYTNGVAPIISFNYGKQDEKRLHNIFRYSLYFIALVSVISFAGSKIFASPLVNIFTDHKDNVFQIAYSGMQLFAFAFLFTGISIFASGMFTAYSNGKISAFISSLRTLIFVAGSIIILPLFLGLNGIWLSVPLAEFLCMLVALYLLWKNRFRYGYAKDGFQKK